MGQVGYKDFYQFVNKNSLVVNDSNILYLVLFFLENNNLPLDIKLIYSIIVNYKFYTSFYANPN